MEEPRTSVDRLKDPEVRAALCDEIIACDGIAGACRKLGISEREVFRRIRSDSDLERDVIRARAALSWLCEEEAKRIADDARERGSNGDPFFSQLVRNQIDVRLRIAGIHARAAQSVNVNVDARTQTVVISDERRAELRDTLRRLQLGVDEGGQNDGATGIT